MNVHTYEKAWLASSLFLVVMLIGTVAYGALGPGVSMIDDGPETIDPNALDEDDRFTDPRVERVGDGEYEAYVVARQFIFQPGTIEVPANSTLTFYITSADVIHGFSVVGTNANAMVIPGEITQLTVELDEPGRYGILCNEYCGVGHHDMEAELVVRSPTDFEGGQS